MVDSCPSCKIDVLLIKESMSLKDVVWGFQRFLQRLDFGEGLFHDLVTGNACSAPRAGLCSAAFRFVYTQHHTKIRNMNQSERRIVFTAKVAIGFVQ